MPKYQIHGTDPAFGDEHYVLPELYDSYEEAFRVAHSNREWVVKVKV